MKTKLFLALIAVSIVIIVIGSFIWSSQKLTVSNFTVIPNNTSLFDELFIDETKDQLSFINAIGNENEQVYIYTYSKGFDIVIYKIDDFADVDLNDIHMYMINDFHTHLINPQRINDFGSYVVTSKPALPRITKLSLYGNDEMNIKHHFETTDLSYLSIKSQGLLIGSDSAYLVKIKCPEKRHFNFAFLKGQQGFILIILTTSGNESIDGNPLLDMLKASKSINHLP